MAAIAEDAWVICIVDDDDSFRKGLARLMRSCGFEVRAYSNAQEFLDEARPGTRTCVLMDVTMPRMSGLELQGKLRERAIELPIIAVSARDDDETRRTARGLGVKFFLRKPVDDRALLDAIAWVTGSKS